MLPRVSARLDFSSRGCVSYLPYFASFFFLLSTYFMGNEAHFQIELQEYTVYINIYIYIYRLFPSVHQIALYYDHCKNMFSYKFSIKLSTLGPTETFCHSWPNLLPKLSVIIKCRTLITFSLVVF